MNRIQVVAFLAVLLSAGPALADKGQEVYEGSCKACHTGAIPTAPRVGDKAAWAPRVAKGVDALVETVKAGKAPMPPKGNCGQCSDADLKAAVEYMISQVQ